MHLGWIDLIVLAVYLASAIVIGIAVSGKAKSLEAYLLGDRDLPWWAILGSIVATETSTATVLSVPGEAAGLPGHPETGTGMKLLHLPIGYIIGRAIIVYILFQLYSLGNVCRALLVADSRWG